MVAAWGGYVFVINLIGCHAGLLFLFGRYSTKLYRAYTAFYIVGTTLAMQVPVVGWAPIKSLEQLGPCAVFLGFQLIEYVESQRRKHQLSTKDTWKLRVKVVGAAALVIVAVAGCLSYMGYFGPISSRIRGLFVKHTKTGNPLVDSVAEHQPAQASAYTQYLGKGVVSLTPIGFALVASRYFHDASSFLLVYGLATYFFSLKMVRLILLTAPIASVLSGLVVGRLWGLISYNILGFVPSIFYLMELRDDEEKVTKNDSSSTDEKGKKKSGSVKTKKSDQTNASPSVFGLARSVAIKLIFCAFLYFSWMEAVPMVMEFWTVSHSIAKQLANPTIIQKGQLQNGETVMVDDYRDW